MAKKVEVEIDVKSNVGESIADLKELKKQLKQTAAGSDDFKRLVNEIDDLEDKLKGAKQGAADWIDTLESAGGPLGALGAGLNKVKVATQSWGAAFKAIGIGLIVSAIGLLVGAFSETEGSMKKLEPLFIAFEKILGGIFEAIQPLLDAFIELATKALPYITDGVKIFYSSLVALFTLVKEGGGAIGKIIKGIFTLDMDAINEGYAQLTVTWAKTVEAFNKSEEAFDKGYAKKTKREKEADKNSKDLADKALQEKIKRMEAEDKLDEARLAKLKAEAMLEAFNDEQKLYVEQQYQDKLYKLKLKEIEDKQALYKKDSDEYKSLEAEKINLQAENIEKTKEFNDKLVELAKDRADKITEFEVQLAKDLQKIDDENFDKKLKAFDDDIMLLSAQQKTLLEGSQAYLENSLKIEEDAYQRKKLAAKNNKIQLEAIETEHEQNIKDIKLRAFIAEKQMQLDRLNVISGIGSSLAQLAGKNKALAIAAIAIEKAAAIGSIIVNTQIANAKALAASPLTFGQPWIAINTVAGALGVAAAVASGVKAVQDINAINVPGGNSQSVNTGASSATMPSYGGGASASIPTINTTGGANPATQISQTIQNAQSKPIRAYVVSSDVSTQQALDRKTNKAATFGLG